MRIVYKVRIVYKNIEKKLELKNKYINKIKDLIAEIEHFMYYFGSKIPTYLGKFFSFYPNSNFFMISILLFVYVVFFFR